MAGPERRMLDTFIEQHTTLTNSSTNKQIYLLKPKIIGQYSHGIRKFEFGTSMEAAPERIIIFLGATGSGKTTFINAMINHILGVEWSDPFRVRLIPEEAASVSQAYSQTPGITSYTIHNQPWFQIPYTLTVVDTPGFGDTSGVKRDREITKQINTFFTTKGGAGLDHISAIGFVVQASLARLTQTQQYIFDSVLSLFGKDIKDNIVPILTFADSGKPKALEALEAAQIETKKHFKFNNASVLGAVARSSEDDDDNFDLYDQISWATGNTSFKKLFEALLAVEDKSLVLTKELLKERESLQAQIDDINKHIMLSVAMLKTLDMEMDILKQRKEDIETNKNFTYKVEVTELKLRPAPGGYNANNCLTCEKTCHFPCKHLLGLLDRFCTVMTWGGQCSLCNCSYTNHKNSAERYELVTEEEDRTMDHIKERLKIAKGQYASQEELIKGQVKIIEEQYKLIIANCLRAKDCKERIQKIALKSNPLSMTNYLDLMIEAEKEKNDPESPDRIKYLYEVKKNTRLVEEITSGKFDPTKDKEGLIAKVKAKYREQEGKDQCCIM